MPVYPGTEQPQILNATTIEKEGFAEKLITMYSHTGTHIDAPGHILKDRFTLDKFGVEKFLGKALVIDLTQHLSSVIEKHVIERYSDKISEVDFVLFNTGWDKKWGSEQYFKEFPTLSLDSVSWLCNFSLKGLGFDCISADPIDSTDLPNHRVILNKDMVIIENLCNLDKLRKINFIFSSLPMKIEDSDGSPVRAIAIIEK
jgi:kynurenine formamidase